jgi:hypothetical protein
MQNLLFCPRQNVWACRNVWGKISNFSFHDTIDSFMTKKKAICVIGRFFVVFYRGVLGLQKRFPNGNFLIGKHKSKRSRERGRYSSWSIGKENLILHVVKKIVRCPSRTITPALKSSLQKGLIASLNLLGISRRLRSWKYANLFLR